MLARRRRPPGARTLTDLDTVGATPGRADLADYDQLSEAPDDPHQRPTAALEALIEAHAVELKLPTVRRRFRALADEAMREQQTPVAYLGALLEAEMSERAERRERRRMIDARFPPHKRSRTFGSPTTRRCRRQRSRRSRRATGSTTARA